MHQLAKMTDQELINKCREGNDTGFTELYRRYARSVYNSIHRIVSHTGEAEDLLQETFFAAFTDLNRLQEVANIEAWIRRMGINRSISHLRKRKLSFTEWDEQIPLVEESYDPEEDEVWDCKIEDIKKSIERLAPGYKTIVNLYLFEQLPQEEIAQLLGLSHSTVRTQYHRAKKKIISSLKADVYYE